MSLICNNPTFWELENNLLVSDCNIHCRCILKNNKLTVTRLKNKYINIIFELQKYELDRKKIIAVINTTYAVVKRKPEKKNQACIRPLLSIQFRN